MHLILDQVNKNVSRLKFKDHKQKEYKSSLTEWPYSDHLYVLLSKAELVDH